MYVILLLPEAVLLLVNRIHVLDVGGILLFGVSFLLTTHCSLYLKPLNMDLHIQRILWLFLGSFVLVLCKLYLLEIALLGIISYYIFSRGFYQYEGGQRLIFLLSKKTLNHQGFFD